MFCGWRLGTGRSPRAEWSVLFGVVKGCHPQLIFTIRFFLFLFRRRCSLLQWPVEGSIRNLWPLLSAWCFVTQRRGTWQSRDSEMITVRVLHPATGGKVISSILTCRPLEIQRGRNAQEAEVYWQSSCKYLARYDKPVSHSSNFIELPCQVDYGPGKTSEECRRHQKKTQN